MGIKVTSILVPALAVLCAASLIAAVGCHTERSGDASPLAVVLVQTSRGSELVSVDLTQMQVTRRVKLRSLCLSIDAPEGSRMVITAQCGGPDRSADTVAGIYRPDLETVEYVDLEVQNPLDVCATAEQAWFIHGLEQEGELVTSRMDLPEGGRGETVVAASNRVRHGSIGARALKPEALGPQVVVPEIDVGEDGWARLAALSNPAGTARVIATLTADWCGVVRGAQSRSESVRAVTRIDDEAPSSGEAATSRRSARWNLVTIAAQPTSSTVAAIALPPLEYGCADSCIWNDRLVLADASGVDMADPGDLVRVFDLGAGKELKRLRIAGGMPAALATWGDRLLVVDGISGDLFVFDAKGRLQKRVGIGGAPVGSADLVVIP